MLRTDADLLLELFSEEIPARMQARAAEDLRKAVTDRLVDAGLVYEGAKAFVTPRRLTLSVHGVPVRQPDLREEKKGPRVGAPDNAIAGFLKGAGLKSIAEAKVQPDKKGDFYVAVIEKPGRAAIDVIGEILPEVIKSFPVAEIDALGRGLANARRADLGAAAAFDRRHVRAGDRGAGRRCVFGRRHRGRQRDARPSVHGAASRSRCAASTIISASSTRPRSCSTPSAAATSSAPRRSSLPSPKGSKWSRTRASSTKSRASSNGRWC